MTTVPLVELGLNEIVICDRLKTKHLADCSSAMVALHRLHGNMIGAKETLLRVTPGDASGSEQVHPQRMDRDVLSQIVKLNALERFNELVSLACGIVTYADMLMADYVHCRINFLQDYELCKSTPSQNFLQARIFAVTGHTEIQFVSGMPAQKNSEHIL